jgi:segregation and condensation protein B
MKFLKMTGPHKRVPDSAKTPEAVKASQEDAPPAVAETLYVHQQVEAVLMTSDRALSTSRIGLVVEASSEDIEAAIEHLNEAYESAGHVMRVQRVAGGWRIETTPEVAAVLQQASEQRSQHKLSPAAIETLSIIAYRQPVMRAEVEAIRGVACGEVLRGLMERRMLRIAGRAQELGRPMLYGTTRDFLRIFGLGSLDDLPEVEGLERRKVVAQPSDDEAADASDTEADATVDVAADGADETLAPADTSASAVDEVAEPTDA